MREELPAAADGTAPGSTAAGARSGSTWGSTLSCQELAAIGSVGFVPVGQVFGAAVYAAGAASAASCPGAPGSPSGLPARPAAQVTGQDDAGGLGPLVEAMYEARQAAVDRMTAECKALGGHGVVGVRLPGGLFSVGGLEFTAIGTAVRVPVAAPLRVPFTSALSGQDFARLITAGWVPAGLVLGIAIGSRHDDRATYRQARPWSGNAEIAGWTDLVNRTRQEARRRLEQDVQRLGAEGVVTADMRMKVRERDCPAAPNRRDHIVEVALIGTAIASFSQAASRHAGPPLTIMPLGTQRSQATWPR